MSVKLLTEHHLKFLGSGSSESTLIKMPHCWKSHVTAHILMHCYILMIAFKLYITITDSAFYFCRYTCQVGQSVTCLTADPGVASSIMAWSHTLVDIDHGIISKAILLPSADSRS